MKKRLLSILLALCLMLALAPVTARAAGSVAVNAANFPDEIFRNYVSANFDTDGDGSLSPAELAAAREIRVRNMEITSLRGVEHFTALEVLDCYTNKLTGLDLRANRALKELTCSHNPLVSLDLSANTALEKLDCTASGQQSLDVSKNTALKRLDCSYNELASLDLSRNTALENLRCAGNKLTSLDLRANAALKGLDCDYNPEMTSLDMSGHSELTFIYCRYCALTSLNLSGCTKMKGLECYGNDFKELDIRSCPLLIDIYRRGWESESDILNPWGGRTPYRCYSVSEGSYGYLICVDTYTKLRNGEINAPFVFTAAGNAENGQPSLQWREIEGAAGYVVYRSGKQYTNFSWAGDSASAGFTDTTAEVGTIYWYKVCAVDAAGVEGNYSSPVKLKTKLPAPTITFSGLNAQGKPYLRWSTVDGAIRYVVYRAVGEEDTFHRFYTTTDTSFNNTGAERGVTYRYQVCAVASDGTEGSRSPAVSVTASRELLAPKITSANGSNATGKPTLKWDAVEGAESYAVYRATSSTGTYTKMYTTANTSYTNTSAKTGYTYYYKVCGVDENGVEGPFSKAIGVHCRPAVPTVVGGNSTAGKPKLTWSAVPGAVEYVVYRSDTKNGTYEKMYTTKNTSYTNTTANTGYTYYYKVYAVDGKGYWSLASTALGAHCRPATPTVTAGTNSAGKPRLTWSAVKGAGKYVVYRSTSKTGTYTKLYTTVYTYFNNTGAEKGKTYWYKVYAVDNRDFWSAASTPVSAKATK